MRPYKAEYAGGACEFFEAKNDADAIRKASEIALQESHPPILRDLRAGRR